MRGYQCGGGERCQSGGEEAKIDTDISLIPIPFFPLGGEKSVAVCPETKGEMGKNGGVGGSLFFSMKKRQRGDLSLCWL